MKEFEAQKLAPSASVVNVNKRPTEENKAAGNLKDGKQKSLFSQKRLKTKDDQMKKKFHLPDKEEPTNSEFNVLNEIVEKNVSGPLEVRQPSMPAGNAVGKHFPDVMKLVEIDPKTDLKDKKKQWTGIEDGWNKFVLACMALYFSLLPLTCCYYT